MVTHGEKAVERVIEHQILWKLFSEAIRVMKLDYYEQVTHHFKNLTEDYETTLNLLTDLKFNGSGLPEYQSVLGYLRYWSEEH